MKERSRKFSISKSSLDHFKFMSKELGLKSTIWARFFVENELKFFGGHGDLIDGNFKPCFKVYRNDLAASQKLEEKRSKENQVKYDVFLSDVMKNKLKAVTTFLGVSQAAFVEFSLEFACYRLVGFEDVYNNKRSIEVKAVFFLEQLGSKKVTSQRHLEFYQHRLQFTKYREGTDLRDEPYENKFTLGVPVSYATLDAKKQEKEAKKLGK